VVSWRCLEPARLADALSQCCACGRELAESATRALYRRPWYSTTALARGDEYKLRDRDIPDATTDPSQIRVLAVVDPTAKTEKGPEANGAPAQTTAGESNSGDQIRRFRTSLIRIRLPETRVLEIRPEARTCRTQADQPKIRLRQAPALCRDRSAVGSSVRTSRSAGSADGAAAAPQTHPATTIVQKVAPPRAA